MCARAWWVKKGKRTGLPITNRLELHWGFKTHGIVGVFEQFHSIKLLPAVGLQSWVNFVTVRKLPFTHRTETKIRNFQSQ